MKFPKKVLLFTIFLLGFFGLAGVLALALSHLIGGPLWAWYIVTCVLHTLFWILKDKIDAYYMLKDEIEVYNQKPYKQYMVRLPCQHCATMQPVEIDLVDDEFVCTNCGKENRIIAEFKTVARIPEVDEMDVLGRMKKIHDAVL